MAVVFSPSNLGTFRNCPRRFFGQSVSRELKWVGSKQKSRGTAMHQFVQDACRLGWPNIGLTDTTVDASYTQALVERLHSVNAEMFIEHEMAMTAHGKQCDWWAGDAFLRARADIFMLPPAESADPILVGDIKTGKNWDDDHFQLRTEARSAGITNPAGVVRCFQVSVNNVPPSKRVLACNLLSNNCVRAALADEPEEAWPQVPLVRSPSSFACRAERRAGAASCPDWPVVRPSCEAQSVGPATDACEEMTLGKFS